MRLATEIDLPDIAAYWNSHLEWIQSQWLTPCEAQPADRFQKYLDNGYILFEPNNLLICALRKNNEVEVVLWLSGGEQYLDVAFLEVGNMATAAGDTLIKGTVKKGTDGDNYLQAKGWTYIEDDLGLSHIYTPTPQEMVSAIQK